MECGDELTLLDQADLQRQQAKQQIAVGCGGHEVSPGRGGTRHGRPQFWSPHSVASREPYCQTIIRPGIPDGPDIIPGLMRSRADVICHGHADAQRRGFDSLSRFSAEINNPLACEAPLEIAESMAGPVFVRRTRHLAAVLRRRCNRLARTRLVSRSDSPEESRPGLVRADSVNRGRVVVDRLGLATARHRANSFPDVVRHHLWFRVVRIPVPARSPAYAGPAQPGRKVPQFAARLADGTPFTSAELERGTWAVLVFYRGHW